MTSSEKLRVRTIAPTRRLEPPDFREIWAYRDLFYFLSRRVVMVRYQQAALGIGWAVVQPVALAAIFTLFFGVLLRTPPNTAVPYPAFILSGMTIWLMLSQGILKGSESMTESEALVTKVYFPRILIPASSIAAAALDLLVGTVVLLIVAAVYGVVPTWHIVTLPAVICFAVLTILGFSLWLAALQVKYRDVHHAVPLLVTALLFSSPIIFSLSTIPAPYRAAYSINPIVGVVDSFRWATLGGYPGPGLPVLVSLGAAVVMAMTGALYFRKAERSFADVI